ncbi:hypothetical protein B0187_06325 [Haemophilus paracuniculus]|uniref:Uncharacterized protein n=1 Tax=Haemophilus paracuniculus TaxID=734 RepID=A0A1T0AR92_9PAST|nr:hypothetical protein [Haemophilus paracuniculus]OOR98875.1 hypothetical protein B0187_06325 [Haemophilus paracuniculus]
MRNELLTTECGILDPQLDRKMADLAIALEIDRSFAFLMEATISYANSQKEIKDEIESLASIKRIFDDHLENIRKELTTLLQGGRNTNA